MNRSSPESDEFRVTAELTEFCRSLTLEDVPSDVLVMAKKLLFDQLAAEIGCVDFASNVAVREYARRHGAPGSCTAFGIKEPFDAEVAALVNATTGHSFEIDDYHPASCHPGCVAVPVSLAVGEETDASGKDLLLGTIIAGEVIARIATAAGPTIVTERFFHPTSAYGVFGSVAASAKLYNLAQDEFVAAFGIAGSHASGTVEYTRGGGDVKRYHAGLGAAGGIRAARLAQVGLTAPRAILEGSHGFLRAFSADPHPEKLLSGLGTTWELLRTFLKPYACCGATIPHLDAFRLLQQRMGFSVDEIDSVQVGTDRMSARHVGSIGPEPWDMLSAQFSTQFAIGMCAVLGSNDVHAYLDMERSAFRDERVLEVARRVSLEVDAESDRIWPLEWKSSVRVRLKSGTEEMAEAVPHGSIWDPMSTGEVKQKFISLAESRIGQDACERVLTLANDLESLPSVRPLVEALTTEA
jgi:2-methylcitrate dehydratase PrpD